MTRPIVLDSGPLGLLAQRRGIAVADECKRWLQGHADAGRRIIVPELSDYEVRRELLRLNKLAAIARLDIYCAELEYLPITTAAMREAARLWASVRQSGRPTAPADALDGDMILSAQTLLIGEPDAIIATTNLRHFENIVNADLWQNITFSSP